MLNLIYEISIFDVLWFFLIFIIISILVLLRTIGSYKYGDNIVDKIISTIISFIFILITVSSVIDGLFLNNIYKEYGDGKYQTVYGKIENYERNEGYELKYEQFSVNDVYFEYGSNFGYWGYGVGKSKGYTLKNDIQVKISYVYDDFADKNLIVKMEVAPET